MFKIRFLAIFVLYKAKDVVYLAICRVFKFFRLFKICVVYLAIFVVYLAKPLKFMVPYWQLAHSSNSWA